MNNLGRSWERNVRNHRIPARRLLYPNSIHTLLQGLPTGFEGPGSAPLLGSGRLSTEKAAFIIIIKEE
jgi:hypothetical protein